MRSTPFALVGTLLIVFFAGCLSDGNNTSQGTAREKVIVGHSHNQAAMMDMSTPFELSMQDCMEGGGVSLYNMPAGGSVGPVPGGPFKLASISDDTGNPKVASYGQPIPDGGETTGIWHTSVICQSYSFNGVPGKGALKWGWVGERVQAPPFDDSGITRQYFVADFSVSDSAVVEALQGQFALHASRNLNTKLEWVVPNTVLHTVLDDEDHGVFETHAKMKDWKPMPVGAWRFWMFVSSEGAHHHEGTEAAGVTYHPISFDIVNTVHEGKQATHKVVDGTGWLSHTRTDAHGATPGAAGNVGGLLFEGFDRTITLGPAPDLTFDKTWNH